MSNAPSVVPEHEYVYRRVHRNHYKPEAPGPIQRTAFCPNKNDEDGLSFYRANMITAEAVADGIEGKPADNYVVVKLRVRDLNQHGLTVIPDEIPPLPGHCITPELNTTSYREQKPHWTDIQLKLCRLAENSIAYP